MSKKKNGKNALKKDCVVLFFQDGDTVDGNPYLDTMEAAIKDCLNFNIGESSDNWEGEYDDEIREIEDLMKKKQYKKAWNLWLEVGVPMPGLNRMEWHQLGKKSKT